VPLSLADRVAIKPDVVFKELSGEAVLLDLDTGVYFGLDETSTRLWQLLAAHGQLQQVYDRMLAEFDVEPERLETDLIAFVADLAQRRLVSVTTTNSR
jgi:hypothetical protein